MAAAAADSRQPLVPLNLLIREKDFRLIYSALWPLIVKSFLLISEFRLQTDFIDGRLKLNALDVERSGLRRSV